MSERLEHYVNKAPFDPQRPEQMSPEMERYYMASQWRIMWWKFRRHRLAVIAGAVLLVMYFSILISEFLAPYNLGKAPINHQCLAVPADHDVAGFEVAMQYTTAVGILDRLADIDKSP